MSLLVSPPSPRFLVANSPVSNITRTGLVSPGSQLQVISTPSNRFVAASSVRTPLVIPPRSVVASGVSRPPLIRLNPASAPTTLNRSLLVTPTFVTPALVTPRALTAPIGSGISSTPIASPVFVTPRSTVVTPTVLSSPIASPVFVTPRTTVVTPTVLSSPIIRSTPVTITPTTTVVAPGSLAKLPPISQTVITPGALGNIPGFGTAPVVRSVSPTVTSVSPVVVVKQGKTIEEKLAEFGYVVTDKIFVSVNDDGGSGGRRIIPQYFKTKNSLGQTSFVELDVEGDVVYEDGNKTLIVSNEATMVPESTQISAFQSATIEGAHGVAYECNGDICTLVKSVDSPNQPIRLVLTSASTPSNKTVILSGSSVAYPVVTLSDVIGRPLATAGIIESATTNIRNAGYQECVKNWNGYKVAASEMNTTATEFSSVSNMIINRLASDLRTLNGFRAGYVRNPPKTEAGKEKYRSVVYNINNRQELLIALYAICQVVPVSTEVIKEQNDNLKQSTKNLQDLFQNLGTVVQSPNTPVVSRTI